MLALFRKEISGFFSSVTGYLVIIIFLIANGLFLWVFPGQLNLIDSGYATLDTFFLMAPWIFLFLVPAVTMRLFAEEKRTGTLELLLVRPMTPFQLILAKYLAALTLVLFSLLPTLVYFLSVYLLADPPGNMDTGATWGSYTGLFLLASLYAAIGLFCSSLTENQVIAFILAAGISFFMYQGFKSIGLLPFLESIDHFVIRIGISEHYQSLSRGVIDSRDIFYFLGWNMVFLLFTRTVLESRTW
ncbi:MAG TPA: gliding motility-associated ABC transporter permease subunit GldF [Bacteroidetes bacterium]|nr:gliding motility-associated ABC transporter permease subunit GldF [Bacteroidota bacterium]